MKLGEALRTTRAHLNVLYERKCTLSRMLEEGQASGASGAHFDRVEITRELSAVEEAYEQTQGVADELSTLDANLQNAEIARQQGEAAAEAAEEILKILEVFRRIARGDKVPVKDEKKLMEYSQEMYLAAKSMALINQKCEGKRHKSLWEEEEPGEEPVDPAELAAGAEVGDPLAGVRAAVRAPDSKTSAPAAE